MKRVENPSRLLIVGDKVQFQAHHEVPLLATFPMYLNKYLGLIGVITSTTPCPYINKNCWPCSGYTRITFPGDIKSIEDCFGYGSAEFLLRRIN